MTDDERTAIQLATAHYRHLARRHEDIRIQLGMTPTRFAQHISGLLERADVVAEMPVEVGRLRRLREARRVGRRGRQPC